MRITLFCDASYCDTTGAAGWGAWAKRGDWTRGQFFGAPFKVSPEGAWTAELFAIVNATVVLQGRGALVGIGRLMVQSDCVRALTSILTLVPGAVVSAHDKSAPIYPMRKAAGRIEKDAVSYLLEIAAKGLVFELRHVKGHSSGSTRNSVNNECDRIAKAYMQAQRKAKLAQAEVAL